MKFEICRVSETDDEALRAAYFLADADRRAKIRSLKSETAQRQCLCAEGLKRKMLSEASGLAASELKFSLDANGKPVLTNAAVQFNLSHSGDFVLCAVDEHPVGVDIEAVRQISPKLIERVCSSEESAFVRGDSSRFLRIWTAKEAIVKQSGVGLHGDLREISVMDRSDLSVYSEATADYVLSIVTLKENRNF